MKRIDRFLALRLAATSERTPDQAVACIAWSLLVMNGYDPDELMTEGRLAEEKRRGGG